MAKALHLYFWGSQRLGGNSSCCVKPFLSRAQPAFLGSSGLGATAWPFSKGPLLCETHKPLSLSLSSGPLPRRTKRPGLSYLKNLPLILAFSSSCFPHLLFLHCQYSRKGSYPPPAADSLSNPWPGSFGPLLMELVSPPQSYAGL